MSQWYVSQKSSEIKIRLARISLITKARLQLVYRVEDDREEQPISKSGGGLQIREHVSHVIMEIIPGGGSWTSFMMVLFSLMNLESSSFSFSQLRS